MKTVETNPWKLIAVIALLLVSALPAQAVLLVRYTFDEATSGTTPALNVGGSVGATANGSFVGGTTRTTSTPANFSTAALSITQTAGADYVGPAADINAIDTLPAMTVSLWLNVQAPASGSFHPLAGDLIGGPANDGWMFYYTHNLAETEQYLGVQLEAIGADLTPTHAIQADQAWTFVAFTWDGSTMKFYSGSPTLAVSQLGTNFTVNATLANNTVPLRVGAYANDGVNGPNGFIDDFRLYNTALSLTQLNDVWLAGFSIPEPSSVMLLLLGGAALWRHRFAKRG